MESWDKKHETWAEEACWYDGTNANGTPRLDRAIKEAHELIDKGMTVRIFDLWDCTAHYINPDRGIAPNVEFSGAPQLNRGASAGTQGSASPPRKD